MVQHMFKGELMKSALLLSLAFLFCSAFVGCKSNSDGEPAVSGASSSTCSLQIRYDYDFDVDPSDDFIDQNVTETASVLSSTCLNVIAGETSTDTIDWISRNGSIMTLGAQTGGGDASLIDLSVSGSSISEHTDNFCNSFGEDVTYTLSSSTINSIQQKLQLTFNYSIIANNCSSRDISKDYQHTALKGVWRSACNNGVEYWMAYYHNAVAKMKYIYPDNNCAQSADMYIEWNGPATIGEVVSGSTKQLNHSYQNFYVKIFDTAMKDDFNTSSICGINSWTTGNDISVKGANCDFSSIGIDSETFPSTYVQEFDIFNITGNSLQLGDITTGDKSTSVDRSSALDGDQYTLYSGYFIIPSWVQ
ncbi:MAG: hypothetical protein HN353_10435 [Bdellovibrionales bacterium]|nr:hypothetical protein [Bdellovibrionales bacterium]